MDVTCNFERVMQHLREGKKARVTSWPEVKYIVMKNNTLWFCNSSLVISQIDSIPTEQILSNNWVIL